MAMNSELEVNFTGRDAAHKDSVLSGEAEQSEVAQGHKGVCRRSMYRTASYLGFVLIVLVVVGQVVCFARQKENNNSMRNEVGATNDRVIVTKILGDPTLLRFDGDAQFCRDKLFVGSLGPGNASQEGGIHIFERSSNYDISTEFIRAPSELVDRLVVRFGSQILCLEGEDAVLVSGEELVMRPAGSDKQKTKSHIGVVYLYISCHANWEVAKQSACLEKKDSFILGGRLESEREGGPKIQSSRSFGKSLAQSQTDDGRQWIFIGAPEESKVYVYEFTGASLWLRDYLVSDDFSGKSEFGCYLVAYQGWLIVGHQPTRKVSSCLTVRYKKSCGTWSLQGESSCAESIIDLEGLSRRTKMSEAVHVVHDFASVEHNLVTNSQFMTTLNVENYKGQASGTNPHTMLLSHFLEKITDVGNLRQGGIGSLIGVKDLEVIMLQKCERAVLGVQVATNEGDNRGIITFAKPGRTVSLERNSLTSEANWVIKERIFLEMSKTHHVSYVISSPDMTTLAVGFRSNIDDLEIDDAAMTQLIVFSIEGKVQKYQREHTHFLRSSALEKCEVSKRGNISDVKTTISRLISSFLATQFRKKESLTPERRLLLTILPTEAPSRMGFLLEEKSRGLGQDQFPTRSIVGGIVGVVICVGVFSSLTCIYHKHRSGGGRWNSDTESGFSDLDKPAKNSRRSSTSSWSSWSSGLSLSTMTISITTAAQEAATVDADAEETAAPDQQQHRSSPNPLWRKSLEKKSEHYDRRRDREP